MNEYKDAPPGGIFTPTAANMSLRDYFAAKALIVIAPQGDKIRDLKGSESSSKYVARLCYQMADAMLAARDVSK